MYFAIDVGGTKTEIGFFENEDYKSLIKSEKFKTDQNYFSAIEKIKNIISANSNSEIQGIGVSFPGPVDKNGLILQATNIEDYENKNISTDLKEFSSRIIVNHDSTCSAIAELKYGNIGGFKKIYYLILGTGLGGAFIENYTDNIKVLSVEPSGMIVNFENGRDHKFCKTKGLLESYVGGGTLEHHFGKSLKELEDSDPIWDEVSKYLAVGINNINCILKPEVFLIGGGIGLKRKNALVKTIEYVKQYNEFVQVPEIRFTEIEGNSSLIGALAVNFIENLNLNT